MDLKRFKEVYFNLLSEQFNLQEEIDVPSGIEIMSFDEFLKQYQTEENDERLMKEAEKFLGATVTVPNEKEIIEYLGRVMNKEKTKKDKFLMPYVHSKLLVQIQEPSVIIDKDQKTAIEVDPSSETEFNYIDVEDLKKTLTQRPPVILSQNAKMVKSGGNDYQFFNFGIPALRGLAVDEKENKFVVVNTCPGAGTCKLVCYALKGGYVQYPAVFTKQTRMLNFLLNDPDGFFSKLNSEVKKEYAKNKKKNVKIIVRWHDAGDFFSDQYKEEFFNVVRDNPDVLFYAYTKLANVATGDKPDNFIINFSQGALRSQEKNVDVEKVKHSVIVPKDLFEDLVEKTTRIDSETGKEVKSWEYKSESAIEEIKNRLAKKYNIDSASLLTYDEMTETPIGEINQYNVIVLSGEGDVSAARRDVLGTYLFVH